MGKNRTRPANITREQFRTAARPLPVSIGGESIGAAAPAERCTGSLGWQLASRMYVEVAGRWQWVQVNLTLTVIGSKGIPPESPAGPGTHTPA